jgi:hypothetical protein
LHVFVHCLRRFVPPSAGWPPGAAYRPGEAVQRKFGTSTKVARLSEQHAPRIASRRLLRSLVWALLLPVAAAFAADAALGTTPLLAVVATVVCIPLATVLVSRAALLEMSKVIEQVAPVDTARDERAPDAERNPCRDALPADRLAGKQPRDPAAGIPGQNS